MRYVWNELVLHGGELKMGEAREASRCVDGLRLHYLDAGDGPVVVLVHGIATSLECWRYTVAAFARTHRVLAIDLPGFGRSERPKRLPSIPETADLLAAFLDELGVARASLVGNSLGGLISLETALRHPDRVERLVLSNSAGLGREIGVFWRLAAIEPIGLLLAHLNQQAAIRGWYNMFYHPRSEPELVRRMRDWIARPDLVDTLIGAIQVGLSPRGQRDTIIRLDFLPKLEIPTLLVWGRDDPIFPVFHAERAQRLIPNARLVVFENCGHCPQLELPLDFSRVIGEFLAALPSPSGNPT